jgi:hypothetical protein
MQSFSFEKVLLVVLEQQIGVVDRRIARSGVSYFATSRFDAIVEILEGHFTEFLLESKEEPALLPHVKTYEEIEARIKSMTTKFPLLSPSFPRSERSFRRSGALVDEIIGAARASDPNAADWKIADSEAEMERAQFVDLWKSTDT